MARDQRDPLRGAAGKLKAAVRHWLNGGEARDETSEAAAAFGLALQYDEVAAEPLKVYAFNWPTLQIFWATYNQWRKVAVGNQVVRNGMDWAQVESALRLSGIKRSTWPLIFDGLRAMEQETLKILGES